MRNAHVGGETCSVLPTLGGIRGQAALRSADDGLGPHRLL